MYKSLKFLFYIIVLIISILATPTFAGYTQSNDFFNYNYSYNDMVFLYGLGLSSSGAINNDVYIDVNGVKTKLDSTFCDEAFELNATNYDSIPYYLVCVKSTDFFAGGSLLNVYYNTVETCSDGVQNQDETAIDKGGACNLLAPTMPNVASQNGTKSTVFSHSYKATDADSPDADISYTITSGSIPNGTELDVSNGTISGTPTTVGTFTFTIGVTDSVHTDSKEYSIVIADSGNNTNTGAGTTITQTSGVTPVQLTNDIFEGSDTLLNTFGTPVNTEAQTKIAEYETFIKNSTTHTKIRGCGGICFISADK